MTQNYPLNRTGTRKSIINPNTERTVKAKGDKGICFQRQQNVHFTMKFKIKNMTHNLYGSKQIKKSLEILDKKMQVYIRNKILYDKLALASFNLSLIYFVYHLILRTKLILKKEKIHFIFQFVTLS